MVQLFGSKARQGDASRGLVAGVTATHLRATVVSDAAFDALDDPSQAASSDPNAKVRLEAQLALACRGISAAG